MDLFKDRFNIQQIEYSFVSIHYGTPFLVEVFLWSGPEFLQLRLAILCCGHNIVIARIHRQRILTQHHRLSISSCYAYLQCIKLELVQ